VIGDSNALSDERSEGVRKWIEEHATTNPAGVALADVDGAELTYGELRASVDEFSAQVRSLGVGRRDIVGIRLRDGPGTLRLALEALCADVVVMPLRHGLGNAEMGSYLERVPYRLILAEEDCAAGMASAARAAGVPVLGVRRARGVFADECIVDWSSAPVREAKAAVLPGGTAILSPTSGTTALPKLVCLSHAATRTNAWHYSRWLGLSEADRFLCVMPLGHLHAYWRIILPTIFAGATVVQATGFDPVLFARWFDDVQPTCLSASPSVYQQILVRARVSGWRPTASRLRRVVSASEWLRRETADGVRALLGVEPSQVYGMSETTPAIALAEHPPDRQPAGAIGRVTDAWQLRIVAADSQELPIGEEGEIVVRGGLINPLMSEGERPEEQRIAGGWFHTGDLGHVDAAGFLFYTGRLVDQINSGGRKVAPLEVEEALRSHPAVVEVLVFPIPDSRLGENVGAAVVLDGSRGTAVEDLQAHVGERLEHFKVPANIVVVAELPKASGGVKLSRRQAAEIFGVGRSTEASEPGIFIAPKSAAERAVARVFMELFRQEDIGANSDFLALGGNSILALKLIARLESRFGVNLSIPVIASHPTVEALAALLTTSKHAGTSPDSPFVRLTLPSSPFCWIQ